MFSHLGERLTRMGIATCPVFTPTNFGLAGLFNNSPGPNLIIVWNVTESEDAATDVNGFYYVQGKLTTLAATGFSVYTGDAAPVGVAYKDDQATPTAIQAFRVPDSKMSGNPTAFPMAILRPGWSMVFVAENSGQTVGVSFFYEWCTPDDLRCAAPALIIE